LSFSDFSTSTSLRRVFPGLSAFLIVLLTLSTTPAFGQTGGALETKTGLRIGATFMTIGGDDAPSDLDRRTGLMAGGFVVFDVAGPLALQPELNYIQKGAESGGTTTKLGYIELPLLLKVQAPSSGPVSPNLFLGPTAALNVNAEEETSSGTTDISDDVRSGELGLMVGVGVDAALGVGTLLVDARYGLGLTSLDEDDDIAETDISTRNQGFMITVGYAF